MALTEYSEGEPFPGRIGVTSAESRPAWPAPRRAPRGAPNVVVVVLDDDDGVARVDGQGAGDLDLAVGDLDTLVLNPGAGDTGNGLRGLGNASCNGVVEADGARRNDLNDFGD